MAASSWIWSHASPIWAIMSHRPCAPHLSASEMCAAAAGCMPSTALSGRSCSSDDDTGRRGPSCEGAPLDSVDTRVGKARLPSSTAARQSGNQNGPQPARLWHAVDGGVSSSAKPIPAPLPVLVWNIKAWKLRHLDVPASGSKLRISCTTRHCCSLWMCARGCCTSVLRVDDVKWLRHLCPSIDTAEWSSTAAHTTKAFKYSGSRALYIPVPNGMRHTYTKMFRCIKRKPAQGMGAGSVIGCPFATLLVTTAE